MKLENKIRNILKYCCSVSVKLCFLNYMSYISNIQRSVRLFPTETAPFLTVKKDLYLIKSQWKVGDNLEVTR